MSEKSLESSKSTHKKKKGSISSVTSSSVQRFAKKLSVVVITYNEERNIADCIRSCRDIAEEIVILDSNSTDKTEEICRSFPEVKFFSQKFRGHVQQKNDAISLCKNEWILSLDADERLSEELKQSLRNFLNLPDDGSLDGLKTARLTFHMGRFIRFSGWYPQTKFRIFRKSKARWAGENPHDYLVVEGKGIKTTGDILHYSFRDLAQQVDTINKFSSIVAWTRSRKGRRFSLLRTIYKPFGKFLEIYFFKLGILDGFPGFTIAISSAYSTFLKEAKIYELGKKLIQRPSNLREDYEG
ncbi:glycosyltransferase, group 2 family protein [Leptospira broomii serovar Hurstbridge str. 5399]|uniref:Glycosyltransferase, group 2 family protein n=1 Tax=Leptospira broomii serovar Hurstbridge str. 5399 TaxID=1049789 RepID=T0G9S6_9LEPT|nr:glycosyltransferase family 2 protein [Leptospira broomii]EQA43554.1 glycosyltransferase, group 2 family protein [Leptospira broomii serovar Hurstbridge str. 5399]